MCLKPFILSTHPLFFQPWWFYQEGASRTASILPCEKCTVDFSGSLFTLYWGKPAARRQNSISWSHISRQSSIYKQAYNVMGPWFGFLSSQITFTEEGIISISHSSPSCPAGWIGFTEQRILSIFTTYLCSIWYKSAMCNSNAHKQKTSLKHWQFNFDIYYTSEQRARVHTCINTIVK